MWHGYFVIEQLADLPDEDWEKILSTANGLGPAVDGQPCNLNHWRQRLDGRAVLYEALFTEQRISEGQWKVLIGAMLGVPPPQMELARDVASYAGNSTDETTYSHDGDEFATIRWFAGMGAPWMDSGDECRGYLKLHQAQWEEEV